MSFRRTRCRWLGLATATLLLQLFDYGHVAAADKLLRWKLKPQQTLRVQIEQSVRTRKTGAGKPTSIAIDMRMEMTWSVTQVSPDGTATITQSLDRFAVNMNTGQGPSIEYDSQSGTAVSGPSRGIASSLAPLIGTKLVVMMNNRGEFIEVKRPAGGKPDDPPAASLGLAFTPEGISQVLRQSAVVLPADALEHGAHWTSNHTFESPLGKLNQTNSYTYASTEDRGGTAQEKIEVSSELEVLNPPTPDPSSHTAILEQKHAGQLWFDAEAGRFSQTELAQSLTLERPYRDLRIRVQADTTTKMTISD